ncbi:hypothetical protein FG87_23940 [Nocardia vulneris]|uniref:Uncharacterized protein n=1 Tax=Nocardia vulneris TaxID=1141657 RepID=A0ABR4ZBW7_9NOCA|nr:hypothetical protein FG87_23940 [Nocardia vulneris]
MLRIVSVHEGVDQGFAEDFLWVLPFIHAVYPSDDATALHISLEKSYAFADHYRNRSVYSSVFRESLADSTKYPWLARGVCDEC